ncbi:RecQ family ATP-dependent DNA helicase [Lolliginicoccus levis]|uniref:RecQ family ATP-dependent DNA helicase n=1 Tax=Lolliginicoccus levis TaxID=2919542 RepID=UPI00241CAEFD|nr:DEAD/DEAH box helicase [Lolliginicoccus levis]
MPAPSNAATSTAATPDLREHAERLLTDLAGPAARLRDDQWTAIEALVVQRRRVLVVQRTGWGKSAVYFLAAKLLRAQGLGPSVIVSPLLALMRNQVEAAGRAGVRAATINSGNMTEWSAIHGSIAAGEIDVLLVSPERLNNPDFRDQVLPHLAEDAGMVVVDEAHCVSDWGHDFRPDYRRIRTLVAGLRGDVPVLATTATANDRVVADIAAQLGVAGSSSAGSNEDGALVLRGSLDRESLHLSVVDVGAGADRAAWLAQHLGELPGSGIIYSLTVSAAEDLATVLGEHGHEVAAYTGRTDPAEREALEADLLANRVKALVATSALGMGFDKPDLGFVVHVGSPSSPISYYQQVGRAGRAAQRAEVLLLPGAEDRRIWEYFASVSFPPEDTVRGVLAALDGERPLSTAALEPRVDLSRSRLEMVLKVLDVDGAARRVKGGWVGTGQPWSYDTERYGRLAEARQREQQAMLDYLTTSQCRMVFLRRQLDDPDLGAAPEGCGRCDNCAGARFAATIDDTLRRATRETLDRPGVVLAPRRQWPTGMTTLGIDLSGRIKDGPEPGRAIGRLTDLGWGPRLRSVLDAGDGEAPEALVAAAIEVLKAWEWLERPTAVIALGAGSHPRLAATFASRLASIGRLRDLGALPLRPGASLPVAQNSAFRVAALHDAWDVSGVPEVDGPVLLVDAVSDTGWTLTLAARALRNAGVPAVLPLAIATTS